MRMWIDLVEHLFEDNAAPLRFVGIHDAVDDILLEMSNLTPEDTGLSQGVIYISTAQASHGPRVKFSLKAGRDPAVSVSISETPVVLAPKSPHRSLLPHIDEVSAWVRLNHVALLKFWNEGTTWTKSQVRNFEDNVLQRI